MFFIMKKKKKNVRNCSSYSLQTIGDVYVTQFHITVIQWCSPDKPSILWGTGVLVLICVLLAIHAVNLIQCLGINYILGKWFIIMTVAPKFIVMLFLFIKSPGRDGSRHTSPHTGAL